jgi:hypothetical protein
MNERHNEGEERKERFVVVVFTIPREKERERKREKERKVSAGGRYRPDAPCPV